MTTSKVELLCFGSYLEPYCHVQEEWLLSTQAERTLILFSAETLLQSTPSTSRIHVKWSLARSRKSS